MTVAFADSDKGHKSESKGHSSYSDKMKNFSKSFKNVKNDKKSLDQLLKDISKLKKEYGDTSISVFVNGDEVTCNDAPVLKSGKVLLPLKPLAKAVKATYTYDPKTKVLVITKGDIKVTLTVGSSTITVNNIKLNLEYKVELSRKGGIMIPMGLLSKILNQKVDFDKDSGTVIVNDNIVSVNDNTTGNAINQFEYSGAWQYGTQQGAFNNDNHWASTTDSSIQIRFNGTQIKLYGAKGADFGKAYVSIDGGTETLVDNYSAARADNTLIYESSTSPAGLASNVQHILKLRVAGLKNDASAGYFVAVDRAEIAKFIFLTPVTPSTPVNLALNKTAVASTTFATIGVVETLNAANAVDGKATTRWSSQFADNEWICVDLGQVMTIGKVKLNWETAYGKSYIIQVSSDGTTWTDVSVVTKGDGDVDILSFNQTSARYVRMLGVQRGTNYGYSLYEFEVYGK
jgi:hypothetical protein